MIVKSLEELQVYQKARTAGDEISAIVRRPSFRQDFRLRDQLASSSEAVAAAISEGFPQKTDRHFASYLYRSRGSSSETRTHLAAARTRHYITTAERDSLCSRYVEIERMLTGLIRWLEKSDRRNRG